MSNRFTFALLVKKTPLEIEELRKKQAMKEKQRQALQKQKEEKLKQKRKGKGATGKEEPEKQKNDDQVDNISDDDDNAYYKEEVGEEPECIFFPFSFYFILFYWLILYS